MKGGDLGLWFDYIKQTFVPKAMWKGFQREKWIADRWRDTDSSVPYLLWNLPQTALISSLSIDMALTGINVSGT